MCDESIKFLNKVLEESSRFITGSKIVDKEILEILVTFKTETFRTIQLLQMEKHCNKVNARDNADQQHSQNPNILTESTEYATINYNETNAMSSKEWTKTHKNSNANDIANPSDNEEPIDWSDDIGELDKRVKSINDIISAPEEIAEPKEWTKTKHKVYNSRTPQRNVSANYLDRNGRPKISFVNKAYFSWSKILNSEVASNLQELNEYRFAFNSDNTIFELVKGGVGYYFANTSDNAMFVKNDKNQLVRCVCKGETMSYRMIKDFCNYDDRNVADGVNNEE